MSGTTWGPYQWLRCGWALALALGAAGCQCADQPGPVSFHEAPRRRIEVVRFDTAFQVGGALGDSVFSLPRLLAADDDRLYVYDYIDAQVVAFDEGGHLLWRAGRQGFGPEEFVNAVDMKVAGNGDIRIIDSGAGRITVLDVDGNFKGTFAIPADAPMLRLVLLNDRTLATLSGATPVFWITIDSIGRVMADGGFPDARIAAGWPGTRQVLAHHATDRRRWFAVFVLGDALAIYDDTELVCVGPIAEGRPFTPDRPSESPSFVAAGLGVSSSRIRVLARTPDPETDLRLIDEYDATNCRYVRSYRLPVAAKAMASWEDRLYLEFEDPAPGILALEMSGDGSSAR